MKQRKYHKTHRYNIIKTYTPDEIKSYGDAEFFTDEEVTDKKIKLRRAKLLNQIGHNCVEEGCEMKDFHFGLGIDKGGGIHLDLYGYDNEGELNMITLDHIKPKSKGGRDSVDNYQPLCKIHNELKSNQYNMRRQFKDLNLIYPDKPMISQNYEVVKKVLTQDEVDEFENMGGYLGKTYAKHCVVGQEYVNLVKRGEGVMMSNHPSETITNQHFINNAYGHVLIFGLGLGMIIFPLLMDNDIKSITVVEKDPGVIDMVGKIVKEHDYHNKLHIFEGDAFTYHKRITNRRFDTIYFDIWIKIDDEAFEQMEQLHDLYKRFKRGGEAYMTSWCYDLKDNSTQK